MTKKICYPTSITQYTGTDHKYVQFKNLANIRSPSNTHAESRDTIRGKSSSTDTKPTYLIMKKFNAKIPTGSKINSITVEYVHNVTATTSGKYPHIGAPTIKLGSTSHKGRSASSTEKTQKKLFKSTKYTYNSVNSNDFALRFDYPENASNNTGKLKIKFIRIVIDYTEPSYGYTFKKVKGGYNHEECSINLRMSNSKRTKYNPTNTIEIPEGFTLIRHSGSGKFTKVGHRVYKWVPNFTKGASSATMNMVFDVDVTWSHGATSYDAIFYVGETLRNTNSQFIVTVTDRPVSPDEPRSDEDPNDHSQFDGMTIEWDGGPQEVEPFIFRTDAFNLSLQLSDEMYEELLEIFTERGIDPDYGDFHPTRSGLIIPYCPFLTLNQLKEYGLFLEPYIEMADDETDGYFRYTLAGYDDIYIQWNFHCPPSEEYIISKPAIMALREEDTEELSRFGDGITYTAEVFSKIYTEQHYVNDWGKNYRMGIFNNRIEANCTYIMNFYSTEEDINFFVDLPAELEVEDTKKLYFKGTGVDIECSDGTILTPTIDYDPSISYTPTDFLSNFIITKTGETDEVTLTIKYEDEWEKIYKLYFNDEKDDVVETIEDSTDYDNITIEEMFDNATYWSDCPQAPNFFEELTVDFTYDADYPLVYLFTTDYKQRGDSAYCGFSEITVTESIYYDGREKNRIYLEPLENVITPDAETPSVLVPAMSYSNPVIMYDLPLGEDFGTDDEMAIRGIAITGEIEHNDDLTIIASIRTDQTTINRSIVLDDEASEFTIGGLSDIWGLNTADIKNMEDWDFNIQFQNTDEENEAAIGISNVQIGVWVQPITEQTVKVYVEEQNLAWYGAFVSNVEIPTGIKTDTDFININGTDVNDPYIQSIREKEIELELDISEVCDLETNTNLLQDLSNLLVNERDEYNRPIPKRLEVSFYPNIYWEYIVKDDFENSIEVDDYTMKLKLIVPSGTGYGKEDIVTGNTGFARGLTPVEPIILLKPSGEDVTITEETTDQTFNFNFLEIWADSFVEIDCPNKRVWLLESELDEDPRDITAHADINTDWFVLRDDYNFSSINASIKSVTFTERW